MNAQNIHYYKHNRPIIDDSDPRGWPCRGKSLRGPQDHLKGGRPALSQERWGEVLNTLQHHHRETILLAGGKFSGKSTLYVQVSEVELKYHSTPISQRFDQHWPRGVAEPFGRTIKETIIYQRFTSELLSPLKGVRTCGLRESPVGRRVQILAALSMAADLALWAVSYLSSSSFR